NIALPAIAKEFSMDAITLNWVTTSYLLSIAVFLLPSGRMADMRGRKKIFSAGILIFTLSSFLSGISQTQFFLISSRILQGIGAAMIFSTSVAILTSVFPAHERGKVLGINVASVYTGLTLGPFLGGILTDWFGWRSVFLVNVPLGILTVALALTKLEGDWADAVNEKFDFTGAILYGSMLVLLLLGISEFSALLVILGFLLLILFILHELRTDFPLLHIDLFRRNIAFSFSNLAALLHYSATFGITFLLSLYLQYIKSLTPQETGMILVAQPAVQAVLSPLAGWLSDRIEPRFIASAGMGITALGLMLFSGLQEETSVVFIIANLVLLGLGFALFSSSNTNAIMSSVEKGFYGVASATLATMRVVGQTLSMALIMLVFAPHIGERAITQETYGVFMRSVRLSFLIFSVLCLIGILASLARGNIRGGE
ncbi:MAG: MFS transporter, partial [Archaeoglobi archaeon]|nr:MFS transporter [Candidatus Mnemosynella bozhongmuii]